MWMHFVSRRKQFVWSSLMFAQLTLLMIHNAEGFLLQCPLHQMHLQKILGFRPPLKYLTNENIIYTPSLNTTDIHRLHQAINSTLRQQQVQQQQTESYVCWHICNSDDACIAYVHLISTKTCYGFTYFSGRQSYRKIDNTFLLLVPDPDAIFYEKSCLKVPSSCKEQRWTLTKIPGSHLVFHGKKTLTKLVDRRECAERCLFETEFKCLSASFTPSFRNNRQRFSMSDDINANVHQNSLGRCILSDKDKILEPSAFRATAYDEEYIENQCHQRQIEEDSCSYELYANSTFLYAEVKLIGLSQKQCLYYCSHETTFYCQGISFYYNNDPWYSECSLHSEDIISMGPRSLIQRTNSVYMRRVKCLEVKVICTQSEMLIKYIPKTGFNGKMYVSNHHYNDNCLVQGNGTYGIELPLHIGNEFTESICGVLRAYEVQNDYRRIFISALIVIQNNPNVQSQGDRLIKVGCIISNTTLSKTANSTSQNSSDGSNVQDVIHESSNDWYSANQQQGSIEVNEPNAITLKSTVDFSRNFLLNEGVLHYNISGNYYGQIPKISMQIIDLKNGFKTNNVQIGEKLELQIISEYTNEKLREFLNVEIPSMMDFHVSSLLAKSGDNEDYIELLDVYGCPTDISIFPGLIRLKQSTGNLLKGQFNAFKFAGTSIHKQKRSYKALHSQNFIYVSNVENTENIAENVTTPATFVIHVRGPDWPHVNSFLHGEKSTIQLGDVDYRHSFNNVCINRSTFLACFLLWLIFHLVLAFTCCYTMQKHLQFAMHAKAKQQLLTT